MLCCCRAASKVYKGKTIEKGIAFPTCVSVNKCGNMISSLHSCYFSVCLTVVLSAALWATRHLPRRTRQSSRRAMW